MIYRNAKVIPQYCLTLAVIALVFTALPGKVKSALYFDEADFIAAVGTHDLETFESIPLGSYGTSAVLGDLTFASPPDSYIGVVAIDPAGYGTHNTTPTGENYLYATANPGHHDTMSAGHIGGQLYAWGANFTDLDYGYVTIAVDYEMVYDLISPGPDGGIMFIGFIADNDGPWGSSFNHIQIITDDNVYGIDDVRTRLVPEPATVTLLCIGSLALFRKQKHIVK
ncbi:MAG: hypothetical protein JW806_03670 [Sedimentisphaerales bacterium]|nr:hypothetical protein [Sedimentisphaerales bacterium]